jgi:hypothetical protein
MAGLWISPIYKIPLVAKIKVASVAKADDVGMGVGEQTCAGIYV